MKLTQVKRRSNQTFLSFLMILSDLSESSLNWLTARFDYSESSLVETRLVLVKDFMPKSDSIPPINDFDSSFKIWDQSRKKFWRRV